MPIVINRHHYRRGFPRPWLYIGRPSPLGNPFRHPAQPDAMERYRRWLWRQIKGGNREVLEMLESITEGTHLVCSCAPRPCHGDVVVLAWRWLRRAATAPSPVPEAPRHVDDSIFPVGGGARTARGSTFRETGFPKLEGGR